MKNYDVNETNGAVDFDSKHSLVYMKLYPYTLFGLAFLGILTTVMWELSASKRAGQTSYIIDGIEEAMGELISALKGLNFEITFLVDILSGHLFFNSYLLV